MNSKNSAKGVSVSLNLPTPALFCSVVMVNSPKPASAAEFVFFVLFFEVRFFIGLFAI